VLAVLGRDAVFHQRVSGDVQFLHLIDVHLHPAGRSHSKAIVEPAQEIASPARAQLVAVDNQLDPGL